MGALAGNAGARGPSRSGGGLARSSGAPAVVRERFCESAAAPRSEKERPPTEVGGGGREKGSLGGVSGETRLTDKMSQETRSASSRQGFLGVFHTTPTTLTARAADRENAVRNSMRRLGLHRGPG